MATLVSAGVSVSVIDESFYIPASAPTVPLFFVATRRNKYQPNGVTLAAGTMEHSVVRTVTSIGQSTQLYGVPYFWKDMSNNEWHGDARNEYGLFALNQFLGIGNRAFVVRANVDLTDASTTFIAPYKVSGGNVTTLTAQNSTSVKIGNGTISGIAAAATNFKEEKITVAFTTPTAFLVQGSQSGIITTGVVGTPVSTSVVSFTITAGTTAFVPGDYFQFDLKNSPSTAPAGAGKGTMTGISIDANATADVWTVTFTSATEFDVSNANNSVNSSGTVGSIFDNNYINFLISAGSAAFVAADEFTIRLASITAPAPLGANDAAKRVAIATALQAEINSNQEVRSEIYEYNLIVCPGYPEVVDELVALSTEVNDEAFVIGDVPLSKTPEQAAVWSLTTERAKSKNAAYYYPWGLASNLDGRNVCVAPSGIALRTYAYSDNQSFVWFAPAGIRRGTVTGVSSVGYVSGTLGTATTFVETNLNQGQRDNLYEFYKNINPIVFFPQQGLVIWGQKTSYNAASALDRVNVMRLVMYIKRQLRKGAFPFVFEPNDKITRDNLKAMADGFLNDILAKRGLYDFVTLCDESNNTPDRIDRNEMYLDVALKPVKAAEFIYIPIRVLSTGAQMPS